MQAFDIDQICFFIAGIDVERLTFLVHCLFQKTVHCVGLPRDKRILQNNVLEIAVHIIGNVQEGKYYPNCEQGGLPVDFG